jgi:RNA polymerase sigma factor for flagellar operon FliA
VEIAIAARRHAPSPPPAGRRVPGVRERRRRDALVEAHLALVEKVVDRVRPRLPRQVERDDLVASGYVGLLAAATGFDESRGVPFGAFARRRILGAILDHLRTVDPLSRDHRASVRAGTREFFEVQLHLDGKTGPADAEIVFESHLATTADCPEAAAGRAQQAAAVRAALALLPPTERHVMEQHFLHDRPLTAIKADLGVSLQRTSNLKQQAVARLRRLLTC